MPAADIPDHPSNRQSGFTLIELMISIVLMALMLGVLASGLRTISNGWDRSTERMSDQDMLLRAADLVRRDISAMQRVAWLSPRGSTAISGRAAETKLNFIFHGASNRLQFVAIEPPYPTRSGPYVLSYSVAGTKPARLTRSRARFHPKMHSLAEIEFEDDVPLIEGAYRLRFMYGQRTRDAAGVAGPWQWLSNWPYADRMPDLIQLEIRDGQTGKLATPPLIARPKIDAEPACAAKSAKTSRCTLKLARNGTADPTKAPSK